MQDQDSHQNSAKRPTQKTSGVTSGRSGAMSSHLVGPRLQRWEIHGGLHLGHRMKKRGDFCKPCWMTPEGKTI